MIFYQIEFSIPIVEGGVFVKVAVAGTGYVGLVTGVCLAEIGHEVTCIDINEEKIDLLNKGVSPIYEPGIEELMSKNIQDKRLQFTTNEADVYGDADFIFIAVGTPENPDGSANLSYIMNVAISIATYINEHTIVVIKSTVPVGTNEMIRQLIEENSPESFNIHVVSNPEFLREGSAIHDTFHGDRVIIGSDQDHIGKRVGALFTLLNIPIVYTDIRSAEMIKYAANAFLATKISFINEISNICEKLGANIEDVAKGIGSDTRIGNQFLNAGIGYGGSCFPKDTKALVQIAGNVEHHFELLESVIKVNNQQQLQLFHKLKQVYPNLRGKRIALLGLAFKPNTDDIREAASLSIINNLLQEHASIIAYDPIAIDNVRKQVGNKIEYTDSIEKAIQDADVALIVTEWDSIKATSFATYINLMKCPIIIDGRNCYSLDYAKQHDVTYYSMGREQINNAIIKMS